MNEKVPATIGRQGLLPSYHVFIDATHDYLLTLMYVSPWQLILLILRYIQVYFMWLLQCIEIRNETACLNRKVNATPPAASEGSCLQARTPLQHLLEMSVQQQSFATPSM